MPGKTPFIELPADFLRQIARESDRTPSLYYEGNYLMRRVFWQRLYLLNRLIGRYSKDTSLCLDFGGGSGVMLPTLSAHFKHTILADLEPEDAEKVVAHHHLDNVTIISGDISQADIVPKSCQAIIAADVLEHFKMLDIPVAVIKKLLARYGILYTSLPTENWVYVLLRKLFGVEKPWDHYHTAYEVEAYLQSQGFRKIRTVCAPLYLPLAPLFLITAWRLKT